MDTICKKLTDKQEGLDATYKVLSLVFRLVASYCALFICVGAMIIVFSVNSILCARVHDDIIYNSDDVIMCSCLCLLTQ